MSKNKATDTASRHIHAVPFQGLNEGDSRFPFLVAEDSKISVGAHASIDIFDPSEENSMVRTDRGFAVFQSGNTGYIRSLKTGRAKCLVYESSEDSVGVMVWILGHGHLMSCPLGWPFLCWHLYCQSRFGKATIKFAATDQNGRLKAVSTHVIPKEFTEHTLFRWDRLFVDNVKNRSCEELVAMVHLIEVGHLNNEQIELQSRRFTATSVLQPSIAETETARETEARQQPEAATQVLSLGNDYDRHVREARRTESALKAQAEDLNGKLAKCEAERKDLARKCQLLSESSANQKLREKEQECNQLKQVICRHAEEMREREYEAYCGQQGMEDAEKEAARLRHIIFELGGNPHPVYSAKESA